MNGLPVVSGSELDTFLRCRMLHTYQFGLHLEPRGKSRALEIGTAGHALLMPYYRALASGSSHAEAMGQAEALASWQAISAGVRPDLMDFALWLVRIYWAAYPFDTKDWRIVEVEQTYRVELDGYVYAATIDLLVEDSEGLRIVDHRFLGRFYEEEMAAIDPQLPRYVLALQAAGRRVTGATRNMVLTGASSMRAAKRVSRLPVPIDGFRLATALMERDRVAGELIAWRQIPLDVRRRIAPRTFYAPMCRQCDFKVPCSLSATGEDDSAILDQHYVPSTYGYSEDDNALP